MNNMSNTHAAGTSDKALDLEEEIEHLTQLLSTVMNQMPSPKTNDPAIHIFSITVPNRNVKFDVKIEMTAEDV